MATRVIQGGLFGDEGKGKIVHALAQAMVDTGKLTLVHRYQGGPNAGHTLTKDNGDKLILHMIPSGAAVEGVYSLLGSNTVTNPFTLIKEMAAVVDSGYHLSPDNFGISTESTVILPHHQDDDKKNRHVGAEQSLHNSTGQGIRQAYSDKMNHLSLRMGELGSRASIKDALERRLNWEKEFMAQRQVNIKDFLIHATLNPIHPHHHELVDNLLAVGERLAPYLVNEGQILNNAKWGHKLFEGAQGKGLDVNYGWHPGTTSSSPSVDAPAQDYKSIGVFKAYVSSVGHGHRGFVSKMPKDQQDTLRPLWNEWGATSGTARSIGYPDLVLAHQSVNSGSGIDFIAITCMDRLDDMKRLGYPLKVVTGYEVDGYIFTKWDKALDDRTLRAQAQPVFTEIDTNKTGWQKEYYRMFEQAVERPIIFVGNGPKQFDYELNPGSSLLDEEFRWKSSY